MKEHDQKYPYSEVQEQKDHDALATIQADQKRIWSQPGRLSEEDRILIAQHNRIDVSNVLDADSDEPVPFFYTEALSRALQGDFSAAEEVQS